MCVCVCVVEERGGGALLHSPYLVGKRLALERVTNIVSIRVRCLSHPYIHIDAARVCILKHICSRIEMYTSDGGRIDASALFHSLAADAAFVFHARHSLTGALLDMLHPSMARARGTRGRCVHVRCILTEVEIGRAVCGVGQTIIMMMDIVHERACVCV